MQAPVKNALIVRSTAYYRSGLVCMHGLNLGIYSGGHRHVSFLLFMCTFFEQTLAQKIHKIPSGGWKDIYRTGNFLGDHGVL